MNHDIKKKEDDEPDEEDSELEAGSSFEEELTDPGQNRMNCLHKRKANGWRKREFNYCMKLWFLKEYTACIRDRDYNYVVVCYDNVNAGTAKVHITFSNMYKGTLTTTTQRHCPHYYRGQCFYDNT